MMIVDVCLSVKQELKCFNTLYDFNIL